MKTVSFRSGIVSALARDLRVSLICLLGFPLAGVAADAKTHLKIAAPGSAIDAFENWTAGISWERITHFKNGNANRPVVDLVLELQALKAGGLDFDFELVRVLTYDQAKKLVIDGRADLAGETIWDNEIDPDSLLKSDTVIRNGEFVKGIYVLPSNQALFKISSLEELRGFTAVVVSTWALDLKTLEDMKLKGVIKCATPEIGFATLQKQQADFILWEFSANPDLSTVIAGVKLTPVPNFKIGIMGSRSWAVGKSSPNAELLQKMLTAGVKALRENGTIDRAYSESGFFNPRVADWKRLF